MIYEGKELKLLAKWEKELLRGSSKDQIELFSDARRQLYLVNKNNLIKIRKKKDFKQFFESEIAGSKSKNKFRIPKPAKATNEQLIQLLELFESTR